MRFRLCIATTALILLGLGAEASPVQAKPAVGAPRTLDTAVGEQKVARRSLVGGRRRWRSGWVGVDQVNARRCK